MFIIFSIVLFVFLLNISAYFLMDYAVRKDNENLYNICQKILYYTYILIWIIWVLTLILSFLLWLLYIAYHLSNITTF